MNLLPLSDTLLKDNNIIMQLPELEAKVVNQTSVPSLRFPLVYHPVLTVIFYRNPAEETSHTSNPAIELHGGP